MKSSGTTGRTTGSSVTYSTSSPAKKRTLPYPIYTISPDGQTAVAPDFRRIQDMRPGYGYAGLPDPHTDEPAPKDSGIFRLNLETGRQDLIISIADIAKFGKIPGEPKEPKHYFNHLCSIPMALDLSFCIAGGQSHSGASAHECSPQTDGSDIHIVDSYGQTSHFIWRDPSHILAWAWHPSHKNAFYLYEDGTDKAALI